MFWIWVPFLLIVILLYSCVVVNARAERWFRQLRETYVKPSGNQNQSRP